MVYAKVAHPHLIHVATVKKKKERREYPAVSVMKPVKEFRMS